jgi:hypothetical protein
VNFSIIPLYNGKKTKIYTIQFSDKELSEYEQFVYENMTIVPDAVRTLRTQLKKMSYQRGLADNFFKRESPEHYRVFRIEETKEDLRLYCIKFSGVAIVLGGGGIKIPGKVKLIENPHLNVICELLIKIEDLINERILTKEIIITNDDLKGNLNFEI